MRDAENWRDDAKYRRRVVESVKRVGGVDLGERGMKEVVVGEGEGGFERWCLGIDKEKKVQIQPGRLYCAEQAGSTEGASIASGRARGLETLGSLES